ncbi:putative peroxisomal membrane protein receptor Pex19 [Aspergillus alliaceus]|nr:Pex19 protein family-domain-containing protein [Aspergillus alliaceus]KAB8228559.1 Pex19 protein family-domain-containing protein [Aspergillus alliaceus]
MSTPSGENNPAPATTTPTESAKTTTTTTTEHAPFTETPAQQSKQAIDSDDDESDLDELDDVLDDFKPTPAPPPPSKPSSASQPATAPVPTDFDEDAFMKQLEKDMANMMGHAAKESGTSDDKGFEDTINQGADAFTKQLEESGIPPGDFIKQLLADVMAEEAGGDGPARSSSGSGGGGGGSSAGGNGATPAAASPAPESFNDAIQQTINRMKESGDKATAAASEDDADDLVAQLLKAIEAGAGGAGDDGDLSKMFMGMMEQLSNKEMLYEPMKELDGKFGPWLLENKGKGTISAEDMERYEKQAGIVSQIVAKFEEKGYTDEDPKCREYVWEKMQEMQAAGSPPEELVTNPFGDELGGGPGGVPECPQQ